MNTIHENDYPSLLMELAAARGKEIQGYQYERIMDTFREMGWKYALRITREISRAEVIPSNLYGLICNKWDALRQADESAHLWKEEWEPKENCVTPEEYNAWFGITMLAIAFRDEGFVQNNPDGITTPLSIDEWIKHNRPVSWSPVLDHSLRMFEIGYKSELQGKKGSLAEILKKTETHLRESLRGRIHEREKILTKIS